MTVEVEERLRRAFGGIEPPSLDVPRVRERSGVLRRHRQALTAAPFALLGLALVVGMVAPLIRGVGPADISLAPGDSAADPSGLSLRVLSVDADGLPAEIDLATMAVTRPVDSPQPIDGGAVVPGGGIITWAQGSARYYPDGLASKSRALGGEPRELPGIAPAVRVIPDSSGRRAWLVEPGVGYGDDRAPALVRTVDLATGALGEVHEIDAPADPVAATPDGLVLTTQRLIDTGEGWTAAPGSERVVLMGEDGQVTDLGAGVALGAAREVVVTLTCRPSSCRDGSAQAVVVTGTDGDEISTLPLDPGLRWHSLDTAAVPGTTLPFPTVSPDGSALLLGAARMGQEPALSTVHVVELEQGAITRVDALRSLRHAAAAWSADGRWGAVLSGSSVHLFAAPGIRPTSAQLKTLPTGHHAIAAG